MAEKIPTVQDPEGQQNEIIFIKQTFEHPDYAVDGNIIIDNFDAFRKIKLDSPSKEFCNFSKGH